MNLSNVPHARLESDARGATALHVSRVSGREAIGQLFEFEIVAVAERAAGVDVEELLGEPLSLVFESGGEVVRRVHGMVGAVREVLDVEAPHQTFRLTLVPRAFRLTQQESIALHVDQSVPELLEKKLAQAGLQAGDDFVLRLGPGYPKRELVVQYKETDLAFVSRLAEHLGLSFSFEHASGRDVMVFTDQNAGFAEVPGGAVPFRGRGEQRDVYRLEETVRVIPRRYVERDYNYRTPQLALAAEAEVKAAGEGTVVAYGGHFKTPEEGQRLARVRAEERQATRRVFEGESDQPAFSAGARVRLEGHPYGDVELLLVEVRHELAQSALAAAAAEPRYRNELRAIRAETPYRPPRLTPKPVVAGVITGVVDAAQSGTYAEVDADGRYRVRFLCDTSDAEPGKASRPVRMAQPHAGAGHGMHFPLRPGVEVLLTCVEGDPDRPIIIGAVPNPRTASPVTAGNAKRNVIRTGGGNEINIDDDDGKQRIKLTTPHQSTVFQLGSPNSPESGAMLETWGASSTVAQSGIAGISGAGALAKTLWELRTAGDLTTVAEPPDFEGVAGTVQEVIQGGLSACNGLLQMALDGMTANAKAKRELAVKAQVKAKEQAEKLESEWPSKELADAKKVVSAEDAKRIQAYEDAVAASLAAQQEYAAAEEYLTDLQEGRADGTYTASIRQQTEVCETAKKKRDAAVVAVMLAKMELDKAHAAATDPAKKETLAALIDKLVRHQAALHERIADDAAATDARRKANDAEADLTTGDAANGIETARKVFEAAATGEQVLFSVVMLAYAGIKKIVEWVKKESDEIAIQVDLAATKRRGTHTAFDVTKFSLLKPSKVALADSRRHTLGSTGSTIVYGEKNLFAFSDKAVLHGRKTAVVLGVDALGLYSNTEVEVAAGSTVKVTTDTVDMQVLTKVTAAAGDAGLELVSSGKTAKLLAGSWNLTLGGAGAGSATLGNATWKLTLSDKAVLGNASNILTVKSDEASLKVGAAGLTIKSGAVTLETGATSIKAGATGAVIKGSKVSLG